MDLKGITWPGNIYQKFEAMCLEVEEVMYQDTVKYLENQVQTVGSSVKKFYSEVMQDIRPPDYVDPVKVAAADLPLYPYSHTEVIKKPKVTTKGDLETIKKKTEDYKVVGDINGDHELAAPKLDCDIDHAKGDIAMRVSSNSYSGNERGAGLYRRHSVNRKGNYKIDSPYKTSKQTNLASEFLSEGCEATSLCQLSKESETCAATDGVCDVNEARLVDNTVCTSNVSVDPPDSGNLLRNIKKANLEISLKSYDTDSDSESLVRMESKTDAMCGSVADEASNTSEGGSDNTKIYAVRTNFGLEMVERLDESKFEDTCVLVEGNELQVVNQKKGKRKSYKKKLQEAFPLRMKSTRKQEYEKLAAQYSAHSSKQHSEDVPDSDWELL